MEVMNQKGEATALGHGDTLLACRECAFQVRVAFRDCIYDVWPQHCGSFMRVEESQADKFNLVSKALLWALSLILKD